MEKGKLMGFKPTRRAAAFVAAGLVSTLALAACASTDEPAAGSTGSGGGKEVTLSLVAYSTPQAAYEKIIAAFQKTDAGKNVKFTQSYGASGDQSRAVASGLPADYVAFSLETDMTRLVDAKLVDASWNTDEHKGMITDSLVSLVTRKGNPKGVKTFDDLVSKDVDVITPNPFSSGAARWNIMGAFGSQIQAGKSEADATKFLADLLGNVSVQDDSGRAALQTFTGGKGDVLISYENEAIAAQQAGEDIDYVIPDQTILIENPVAVTKDADPKAQAFRDFLLTPEAQKIYQDHGYRPVLKNLANESEFPTPPDLFEIDEFGGWDKVRSEFFDPENGSVAKIEEELGVATSD